MTGSSSSSGADRRRDARVAARIEVRFNEVSDAAKALRAYSLNFSAGGLCLKTQRAYAIGTPLRLSLTVEGEAFDLLGVVAWVRGPAIGVRFQDVTPPERERLERLAGALGKRFPPAP